MNPQIAPEAMGDWVRAEYVSRFGQHRGAFLDMGAYFLSPQSISLPFLKAGWGGLLVEADPGNCGRLAGDVAAAGFTGKVDVLCAALLHTPGISQWYSVVGGSELSCAEKEWTQKPWTTGAHYFPMYVSGVTPAEMFERFGLRWDCVSLDLEGVTAKVFNAIPWRELTRARMIVAEMHPDSMMPALEPLGYRIIHSDCVNAVAVRGDK